MNGNRGEVLRRIDTLFSVGTNSALTDGQLLERFTTRRDEAAESAFSVLVERHGPMVLRVSRSLVGSDDAHDVFQATFLVLARRAGSIRARDSVGSWLHGVALRVAAEARSATARRRSHERQAAEIAARRLVASNPEDDRVDLEPTIHEELGRIPERYRIPIILCYLEGLSHEQAAARLRWPIGTVRSRLARGRAKLGERLARRGLAPTALLAWASSAGDAATVPLALATRTTLSAIPFAAGRTTINAMATLAVTSLTEGVLRIMFWTKLRITAAVVAAGAMTAGAAGFAGQGLTASPTGNSQSQATTTARSTQSLGPLTPDYPDLKTVNFDSVLFTHKSEMSGDLVSVDEKGKSPEIDPTRVTPKPPPPAPVPDDSPTDDEVWKKIIPTLIKNPTFLITKFGETTDPCKIYPNVGPARLVHRHFKCTIDFVDHQGIRNVQVVYMDRDRLSSCSDPSHNHTLINKDPSPNRSFADVVTNSGPSPAKAKPVSPGSDQEARLKAVESKLDQILEKLSDRDK